MLASCSWKSEWKGKIDVDTMYARAKRDKGKEKIYFKNVLEERENLVKSVQTWINREIKVRIFFYHI